MDPPITSIDFVARFDVGGRPYAIVCKVEFSRQPRHVRSAVHQLRYALEHFDRSAAPVFVAPYLSEEARALSRQHNVGFLDLRGNCRITLDTVFVERTVPTTPSVATSSTC